MATTSHRGIHSAAVSKPAPSHALLPALHPRRCGSERVTGAFADDLIVQFQSLGFSHAAAVRLLKAARPALDKALASVDDYALAAAPVAERVSMLLPRFDVEGLARVARLGKADVQSALALLVLAFIAQASHPHGSA